MAYFAEVDQDGVVQRVIVADQSFIDSGLVGDPVNWIETDMDGAQRKNYAGVGYSYDSTRNAFVPPKLGTSWVLNEEKCQWITHERTDPTSLPISFTT